MTIIIINTQIEIAKGNFHYDPLPTSIEGCSNETFAIGFNRNIITNINTVDDTFAFYKISFMWYGPLGAIITWITGIVVSYLTGGQEINDSNLSLLSPCVQNLLPAKYRHTQLQVLTAKPSLDAEDCEKVKLNAVKI